MTENYLHSLYPNLRPQIDEAMTQGYSYQEIQDQIAGRVNEARRNGYNDEEIEGYTGAKLSTAKQGYDPFAQQLRSNIGILDKEVARFIKGIARPGQYINDKFGLGESRTTNDAADNVVNKFKANENYWDGKAKERGITFIDELMERIPGKEGINEFDKATDEAVKEVILKKLLDHFTKKPASMPPIEEAPKLSTLKDPTALDRPRGYTELSLPELLGMVKREPRKVTAGQLAMGGVRAANIMAMAKETGLPPTTVQENYDAIAKELGIRTSLSNRELIDSLFKVGIAAGLVAAPMATIAGLATFMGIKEIESLATQIVKGEKPKILAGRQLMEFLGPLEEHDRTVVEALEFVVPGLLSAKVMGITRGALTEKLKKQVIHEAWEDALNKLAESQRGRLLEYKGKVTEPTVGKTEVVFSDGGKGRIGIKEIKDSNTGRVKHEVVVRSDADIRNENIKKAKEASENYRRILKEKQEGIKGEEKALEVKEPPKGKFDPLSPPVVPEGQKVISAVKMNNGDIYFDKTASIHIQVVERNQLNVEDVDIGGYITKGGQFSKTGGDYYWDTKEGMYKLQLAPSEGETKGAEENKITPRLREVEAEENLILRDVMEGKELTPESIERLSEIKAEKGEEVKKEGTESRELEAKTPLEKEIPLGSIIAVKAGNQEPLVGLEDYMTMNGVSVESIPRELLGDMNPKDVKVGYMDPSGKFTEHENSEGLLRKLARTPEGEEYGKFIEEITQEQINRVFMWNELRSKDLANGNVLKVKRLADRDLWEVAEFTPGGAKTGDAINLKVFYSEKDAVDQFNKGTVGIEEITKGKPEGVGAEKARKETKLLSTLLDQQKQAEANLEKLAGMAITDPKKAFLAGNVEALEDYAVRVDKDVFESKMESLHPFGSNDMWLQNGYESPGDFWNKVTRGNREAAKQVFDRNWKKVGELAGDVDAQIDKMINTAERMSREAFNSGDKIGAAREHKKLMDLKKNREVIKREHDKLKQEVDSMTGKMKDWAVMESIDPEYRDQIQTILEDYDLHRRGKEYLGKRQSTLDFIAKQEELGETIYIPEEKIRKLRKVPINDVSIEELREVFDTVEQLAHLGKLKKKLILARKGKDFAGNKDELLSSIKENSLNYVEPADKDVRFPSERGPQSWWGRFKSKIGDFSGATKVEYIADKLDGFKGKMYEIQGKAYDLIFRPSTIAETDRIRLIKSDLDTMNTIVEPIKKDFLRMMREQENVDGRDMTRMEMISVYWNSKNEGNRETLRRGLALTDDSIDNITRRLTPTERKFADDVMVLIQSKGPDIARVLRSLTGQKMKFEKDYFPIWFDYELSERASARQQETNLLKQVYMKVGAEKGFTVSRVGGVEAPYLSFDVVLKHLERVNHFISSAEAIRDVQKILFDKDIRGAIESSAGEGAYRETVEWLKDWGNPKQGYQGDLDRWFGILRHNSTLAVLGFKLSTTILQPTAYLQLVNRIGFKNSMVGLIDFYKDPHGNTAKIYELSPFMQTRSHSFDRDLMDYMNTDAFYAKSTHFKHAAMGMISALDLATTLPAWQSAFNLGVKQFGWNEARAIEYADLIVRRTQASGMPKDLPGVLRGNNFKKSMTMFYTYFSSTYNEAARDYRAFKAGENNIGNLIKAFTLLFVAPAAIQTLLRKREDVKAEDFVGEIIGNVAGTIPYIGPIINAIITGYDYQASPIFEMPKRLVMAVKSKEWEKTVEHLFMASGYAIGIPARQTILTIKYLGDVLSGRSYDPANLIYREKEKKEGKW